MVQTMGILSSCRSLLDLALTRDVVSWQVSPMCLVVFNAFTVSILK